MNTDYQKTKKEFKKAFRAILNKEKNYALAEAAFPAYSHANPLIDFLFWQRIKIVYEYILKNDIKTVIDFGCGSGIMSYLLANQGIKVYSMDVEMSPLKKMEQFISFPKSIDFINTSTEKFTSDIKVEAIVALDVLEHIENLEEQLTIFHTWLKPNGEIIVSGPTENIFYKIGRKLAGSDFSGDYHVSNIQAIKQIMKETTSITPIKTLYPVINFFEIFKAEFLKQ
jgi:2-polyprenyl-3-methyl-5-hydroxy-6-metoxy-1,4-benzoquinol methylase